MSLENEYYNLLTEIEEDEKKLADLQSTEIKKDENNPFTVEERIEAKNRAIRSIKNRISENKEILAEVKKDLKKYIAEGGDVSEETKKEIESEDCSDSINLYEQDKEDLESYLQKKDMDLNEFLFNNNSFKKYMGKKEVKLHITGVNNASMEELLRFHLKAGRILEKTFGNVNNVECIIDIENLINEIKSTQDGAFYAEVVESNGFINPKFNFNTNAQLIITQIIEYVEQLKRWYR